VLIDSGASRCIFHADVGRGVGFDIEKGEQEQATGISGEPTIKPHIVKSKRKDPTTRSRSRLLAAKRPC